MTVPPRPDRSPTPGEERALVRYVRRTVFPYSQYYRRILRSDEGTGAIGATELSRMPPTDLAEIDDPSSLVLRPDLRRIVRQGDRRFAARTAAAKAIGGMHRYNRRVVEHRFKPVHWVLGEGVPLGYSAADLERLGDYGARWLEQAGVGDLDVVVSLLAPGPTVAHWQLVFGCRKAGVSAIHLDPSVAGFRAEGLMPSVLVGEPQHLIGLLAQDRHAGGGWVNLRTVIATGDPLSAEVRARLADLAGGAAIVGAWAPPGVRSLWSECRAGASSSAPAGYHAWEDDVLEVGPGAGAGELLWTGVGWRGSAIVRLRTYTTVVLERGPCPACGRGQARIVPVAPMARPGPQPGAGPTQILSTGAAPMGIDPAARLPLADPDPVSPEAVGVEAILDAEADVAAWQVEYRIADGAPETIVLLAPAWGAATVPLIRRLDRHLRATQFVVLSADEVTDRIARAGGRRILGESP